MNEIIGYDVVPLNLHAANFRRAILDGAELRNAECRGSDFSGASLKLRTSNILFACHD
ncbi:MAG: pentapeptide repeat-containing protein [Deltaproteobacteria bacterium]|nr:pentapeptide repeat-containing protein [Deltaproteobacteria bacterium]